MHSNDCIGDRIKALREKKKFTQEGLGNAIGVSRNTVVNWETGKRKPRFEDIQSLMRVFACEANDLLLNPPQPSAQQPEEPGAEAECKKTA